MSVPTDSQSQCSYQSLRPQTLRSEEGYVSALDSLRSGTGPGFYCALFIPHAGLPCLTMWHGVILGLHRISITHTLVFPDIQAESVQGNQESQIQGPAGHSDEGNWTKGQRKMGIRHEKSTGTPTLEGSKENRNNLRIWAQNSPFYLQVCKTQH